MEKEAQPDSIATVTIKPEYPPSEVYSSEPPPAYHRSQSSAVQVAKIIAVTVVLMSVILGGFLLASAYVTANASCRQLELELLNEAADDKFQAPLRPEALVQEEPLRQKQQADSVKSKESDNNKDNEINNNSIDSAESDNSDSSDSAASSSSSDESEEEEKPPIHFKLPLQLDFDDLAGAIIEKNQKSRMNCIVEKKRAEEVVDHQPKTLRLPFGLNLTTDPRYERISGERMAIFCESGNSQRQAEPEDDSEDETIMIQPVMIPIPQTHFPTHMAQQLRPIPQQNQYHPMETMRPPMPPMAPHHQQQQQQQQNQFPPNQVLHHIAQQIIAQKIMEARHAREEQQRSNPEQTQTYSEEMIPQRIPVPEEVLTQLNRLPNHDMIVTVSRQESEDVPHEQEIQEMRMFPQEGRPTPQEMHTMRQEMRVSMPEMHTADLQGASQDVNRGPQEVRGVPQMQIMKVVPQEIHVVQQEKDNAQEMNGRQAYARGLPVHIPVHMIQQEQEAQAAPSEETRPHYVQPRSVRSIDGLLNKSQKRVKRCSCDCAC